MRSPRSNGPRRTRIERELGVAALSLGLTFVNPTRAAEPGESTAEASSAARIAELNESGARAYAERNYRAAIEKFVEAYAIDHDPNLLFNVARCYEKLGDLDAAVEKYQAFVAAPGADTEGRIKAKASLVELERLRERSAEPEPEATTSAASSSTDTTSASSSRESTHALWGWTTLGAGAVLVGAGATFYALGVRDHRQVTGNAGYTDPSVVHPLTRQEAQSYVDGGDTKKLVGGVGLGLGGALLATGIVLLVTGKSEPPAAESQAGLTLTPGPHGVFAGYFGRF